MTRRPETCPHRRETVAVPGGAAGAAECGLLRAITGAEDPALSAVGRDACEFCCRSPEPSAGQFNPVFASLVYTAASRVIAAGGVPGCGESRAEGLRRAAERQLDTAPEEAELFSPPGRAAEPCVHLGGRTGGTDGSPVFACDHPAHREATPAGCLLCRDWAGPDDRPPPPIDGLLPIPGGRARVVRSWSAGVTTAPRRRPTLEWTLDSLARAGWSGVRVFADGDAPIPKRYADNPLTRREPKVGAWPNFYMSLVEMLMRDPHADAYFLVQDDAELYDRVDLKDYLERFLWPGDPPGPVSLFCSEADARAEFGWWPQRAGWFLGAQAMIFPRGAAQEFVIDPNVFGHRWNPLNDGLANIDTVIGRWSFLSRTPLYYPTPSLCRHTGHTSALWAGAAIEGHPNRKEGPFAGDVRGPDPADFPEGAFACPADRLADYRAAVERGRARMNGLRVVVCGLCRDVRPGLEAVIARVRRLGSMFRDYRVVLYENDSADGTLAALRDWERGDPRVSVVSERHGHARYPQVRSPERAERLAFYRNRCRDFAVAHCGDFDHAVVADMDLGGGWSYDGIAHSFGTDGWDVVGSNGLALAHGRDGSSPSHFAYFDTWAFRQPGRPDPLFGRDLRDLPTGRGDPLVTVSSSFGGLAVYRMEGFKAAAYGGGDCEHVVLHRALADLGFGRIFMNPSQIVLYQPLPRGG